MRPVEHWQIVSQLHGATTSCELSPEETLRFLDDPDGMVWETVGDHAGFGFGEPVTDAGLPEGWYELTGRIECLEGVVTLPSLHPSYPRIGGDVEEIPLPDIPPSGRLRTLVLFKCPVSALRFCPSVWAARFRLHDFRLRRVSRVAALWMMLRGTGAHAKPRETRQRVSTFVAGLRSAGLRTATTEAFSGYLKRQRPPGMTDYDVWVRKYDTFTANRLTALQRRVETLEDVGTTISVLLPVSGSDLQAIRRCVDGVRQQLWGGWELCVVFDASCDVASKRLLQAGADGDTRIRIAPSPEMDAVAAFNRCLDMATASHVVVLGTDVELRRHALLEMAALRQRHPDVLFAYADEDWVEADGRRCHPYFKPEWNPDLLRSQSYIGPFAMISAELARAVGGLKEGYGDSSLHELFLRCTENLQRPRIRHVPHILYHRHQGKSEARVADGCAGSEGAEGARAVAEHLARRGIDAKVDSLPGRTFHVHWPLPPQPPKISLIIPTRDRVDLLRTCVESILAKTRWPNLQIVVVDNHSTERNTLDYLDELRNREHILVLRDDAPFNYAAINNRAVGQCDGELVCLVNNDIEVISPGWLEEMASHALRPEIGAVGAMLYYPDDTIQHAGVIVGLHGVADHVHAGRPRGWPGHGGRALVVQELSAVTAACLLVRRSTYLAVQGLDERLAVAFNDVDFCLRLREHGFHNIWTPHAELYHHESASRGTDDAPERKARYAGEIAYMRRRWAAMLRADPAYNPNLSLRASDSGLASPPRTEGRARQ